MLQHIEQGDGIERAIREWQLPRISAYEDAAPVQREIEIDRDDVRLGIEQAREAGAAMRITGATSMSCRAASRSTSKLSLPPTM